MIQKTFFFFFLKRKRRSSTPFFLWRVRVEKIRVEDRADCFSWWKVWQRYVDLIIFTIFVNFLESFFGCNVRHYDQALLLWG